MSFVPRLNDNGILNNPKWYSQNPFYQSGYGMPNCTCYAYGRFWEISDPDNTGANKPVNLPLGDGGQWWPSAVASGYYETGQIPQLGAVICFSDNNGRSRTRCNSRRNKSNYWRNNLFKFSVAKYILLAFIYYTCKWKI